MNTQGNNKFWEEFINMYRQFPCLWDVKCKNYADRNLRNTAIEELVEKCKEVNHSANKDFVMKKIHNFRCGFRRELKKIKESKTTGASADDVYVPSLWYFDIMSFITDSETSRKGVETIETETEGQDIINNNDSEDVSKNLFLVQNFGLIINAQVILYGSYS